MASSAVILLLLLATALFAAEAARHKSGSQLASNLEVLRRRLVESGDGYNLKGASRELTADSPYPSFTYGYYYYGYYGYGAGYGADHHDHEHSYESGSRRMLLGKSKKTLSTRALLAEEDAEYPYAGSYGPSYYYYGGYYGYGAYTGGDDHEHATGRRLSAMDRIRNALNSNDDGFNK